MAFSAEEVAALGLEHRAKDDKVFLGIPDVSRSVVEVRGTLLDTSYTSHRIKEKSLVSFLSLPPSCQHQLYSVLFYLIF